MSYRPQAFGFFLPTGGSSSLALPLNQANSFSSSALSPKEYFVLLPARQAYSHSASDGSRITSSSPSSFRFRSSSVALRQKSLASSQLTISTELRGPVHLLGFLPITASYSS